MTKPLAPHVLARNPQRPLSLYSQKLSLYLLVTCGTLFVLFQIHSLRTPLSPPASVPSASTRNSFPNRESLIINTDLTLKNCSNHLGSVASKLQESVTFLPLKDLRYAEAAQEGHTWFMSSMYDTHVKGEVQYQQFPSSSSRGRLLCIKGHDNHEGAWNSYALAWPQALPKNATLMRGLTFISNNHYNYDNLWHGLSALVPFVAWRIKNECATPSRWILYHRGELRYKMASWLKNLMEATYSETLNIQTFEGFGDDEPLCFEKAVVIRHNEGGLSGENVMHVYDFIRCKARFHCNLSLEGNLKGRIGMTMLMRTGARSFRNESEVVRIFSGECRKVEGCQIMVAHSNNLTFCQQVQLMSLTDILISPHGAQLTNLFLMDKNSSVMEFFPKGWLKLAGEVKRKKTEEASQGRLINSHGCICA
ncbi:Glycosyltransferase AER [Heracleum sosnowskyi]|uniref:Glycosyltransferase AER n=1 Tax=Heracleum sosnowskyi TaxID=360622 RepID=A0AAD8MFK2_9APIA|nr:Glycosyltransferase AER [Heracleum sosnowskyi]